jgi:hypothetical protein
MTHFISEKRLALCSQPAASPSSSSGETRAKIIKSHFDSAGRTKYSHKVCSTRQHLVFFLFWKSQNASWPSVLLFFSMLGSECVRIFTAGKMRDVRKASGQRGLVSTDEIEAAAAPSEAAARLLSPLSISACVVSVSVCVTTAAADVRFL